MRLNVGCGHYPAVGWHNTDVDDTIARPDQKVTVDDPFPFSDDSVDEAYLGHVLEHVRLDRMDWFLGELGRVLKPGARVCVVGPDTIRVIEHWRQDRVTWDRLWATLEGPDPYDADVDAMWEGAAHQWNCYEARVVALLVKAGFLDVQGQPITPEALEGWPVVDIGATDQMAVTATNPA